MTNLALVLAATAISFVAAAPAEAVERDCGAVRFNGGTYFISYMRLYTSIKAAPGQTITATIVDAATCAPYTATDIALTTVSAFILDRDWDYDPTNGLRRSSFNVNGSNTISFVAAVPNGGTNLDLSVGGTFRPGNLTNLQWAIATLGVEYTVA